MKSFFGKMLNKPEQTKIRFYADSFQFSDGEGTAKLIIPEHKNLTVSINGEKKTGTAEVSKEDSVTYAWDSREIQKAEKTYHFIVSDDRLQLSMTKKPLKGRRYSIKQHEEFVSSLEIEIIEEEYTDSLDSAEWLKDYIFSNGYNGDYLEENLHYFCDSEEVEDEIPILKGKEPKPGTPSHFKLVTGLEHDDFVEKEMLIATFVEETDGTPGKGVKGEEVLPPVINIFPSFGDNIVLEDRGVVSLRDGRVCFENGFIDVIVQENIDQNLNWEDGFVQYEGDVYLTGDIKEGAQIKVKGHLTVDGGIFESYVFVDGDITVNGNVDHSVVYGGFRRMSLRRLEEYSIQILQILEKLMFETSFTAEDGNNYEHKRTAVDFAKDQMKIVVRTAEPFVTLVDANGSDMEKCWFAKFHSQIEDTCKKLTDEINADSVKSLMDLHRNIIEDAKLEVSDRTHKVVLKSANSSHIFASGNIHIEGAGTYLSFLESGTEVHITGLCTGTTVVAENAASINEFNPGTQKEVKLKVNKARGNIRVNKRHANSLFVLGTKENVNLDCEKDIFFDRKTFPKNGTT